jgi:hypothetical protein
MAEFCVSESDRQSSFTTQPRLRLLLLPGQSAIGRMSSNSSGSTGTKPERR